MNNLAKIRAKHGLTQEELGKSLGITKAAVCFYEKNKLNGKSAEKFAEILGENKFDILGTDALTVLPTTPEEKAVLIKIIEEL